MEVVFDRVPRRIKSRSWPQGAARFRLFLALRQLGVRREAIEARLRQERELNRRLELERTSRRVVEAARLVEEQAFREAMEARRNALRIKEAEAFDRMTEEQRESWRMEEAVVGWVSR